MNEVTRKGRTLTLYSLLLLAACSGSDSTAPAAATGTLSLAITDAPVHNAEEVWIQFSGVTIKPQQGEPVDFTFDEPRNIELASLTDAQTETLLANQTLKAGPYNWIRLNVNADADGEFDSYVMTDLGEMVELEVVSQQGLQLSSGFTITQGQHTSFIIDWDLNKGLTAPAGMDTWRLRPSLRITDETAFGEISGTVSTALVEAADCDNDLVADTGNAVYVYQNADVVPDDIDETDPEPLVTGEVQQDQNGAYTYMVPYLSPGDYTVAFTCQGLADDPATDDAITFGATANATVSDGEETVVDF